MLAGTQRPAPIAAVSLWQQLPLGLSTRLRIQSADRKGCRRSQLRTTRRQMADSSREGGAAAEGSSEAERLVPIHATVVEEGKASAPSSTATLVNVAVGAGVLSLPFAFSCTGWALGLGLTVAVAAVEASTLCVLCKYAEESGARSYSVLVNQKLGVQAGIALSCIMAFYLLLTCTAYVMIAADCICPLLAGLAGPEAWWAGRQAVVAAVGLGVALPLSLPRRLGAIAGVSTFKVYAIVYVVGAVVLRSLGALAAPDYSWADVHAVQLSQRVLAALPILAFGFQCHTAVVSVWDELEDQPSLLPFRGSPPGPLPPSTQASSGAGGRSQKLQGMIGVAAVSIGAVACFYSVMGFFGYLAFPLHVESNVMNSFSQSDPVMQVARAMVGLIVIAAYPVNSLPARTTFLDLLGNARGAKKQAGGAQGEGLALEQGAGLEEDASQGLSTLVTLAFCLVTTGIALQVNDLGSMFQLIGGTAASVIIFGIPGALLIQASLEQQQQAQAQAREQGEALMSPWLSSAQEQEEGETTAGALRQLLLTPQQQQGQRWWSSGAWWAGVALEATTVGLWGVTIYNLFVLQ